MDLKRIGEIIKQERLKRGLTQLKLSEQVNISSVHLSHIETGSVSMSLECFLNLCNSLEVTPNHILLNQYQFPKESSNSFFIEYIRNLTHDEINFLIEVSKLLDSLKINHKPQT